MSFDLRINNGDIALDDIGRLELVRDTDKVIQDVLKIVSTTKTSDLFDKSYGISTSTQSIGSVLNRSVVYEAIKAEIQTGLNKLILEQNKLSTTQVLTQSEKIKQVDNITVERDAQEPRQFNIGIELTLQSREPITIQTSLRPL